MSTFHLIVDAHVHLHDCYRLEPFLDGAVDNMRRLSESNGSPTAQPGYLLLADMAGQDAFERLGKACLGGGWTVKRTTEDVSLLALREGVPSLVLVAGRQVVCRERLELLALGVRNGLADGCPLMDTLRDIHRVDAVPVLPWGFGKWWFKRGRLVEDLIRQHSHRSNDLSDEEQKLFLGDNGGRSSILGLPMAFRRAGEVGLSILAGSDPLPFPSQERDAGRYGFTLPGTVDQEAPWRSLKERLITGDNKPQTVGRLQTTMTFVRQQIKMQMRKRGFLKK